MLEALHNGYCKLNGNADADGLLIPFAEDVEVAFDGVLENTYQLGIGALYLTATANYVTDVENRELTPTILDTSLIRKVKDYFEVTTVSSEVESVAPVSVVTCSVER